MQSLLFSYLRWNTLVCLVYTTFVTWLFCLYHSHSITLYTPVTVSGPVLTPAARCRLDHPDELQEAHSRAAGRGDAGGRGGGKDPGGFPWIPGQTEVLRDEVSGSCVCVLILTVLGSMDSSTNFQAPPNAAYFLWSCGKVYHNQEICFLLYFLGQIVSWQYNPNLLD